MEIRNLPTSHRPHYPTQIAIADERRDLVERFVPVAAVLAAIVTLMIIWC